MMGTEKDKESVDPIYLLLLDFRPIIFVKCPANPRPFNPRTFSSKTNLAD
jgi:hypothetical protein